MATLLDLWEVARQKIGGNLEKLIPFYAEKIKREDGFYWLLPAYADWERLLEKGEWERETIWIESHRNGSIFGSPTRLRRCAIYRMFSDYINTQKAVKNKNIFSAVPFALSMRVDTLLRMEAEGTLLPAVFAYIDEIGRYHKTGNQEPYKRYWRAVLERLSEWLRQKEVSTSKVKLYLFMEEDESVYRQWHAAYLMERAAITKETFQEVEGERRGGWGFQNNLNKAKPSLIHHTSFRIGYRWSIEDLVLAHYVWKVAGMAAKEWGFEWRQEKTVQRVERSRNEELKVEWVDEAIVWIGRNDDIEVRRYKRKASCAQRLRECEMWIGQDWAEAFRKSATIGEMMKSTERLDAGMRRVVTEDYVWWKEYARGNVMKGMHLRIQDLLCAWVRYVVYSTNRNVHSFTFQDVYWKWWSWVAVEQEREDGERKQWHWFGQMHEVIAAAKAGREVPNLSQEMACFVMGQLVSLSVSMSDSERRVGQALWFDHVSKWIRYLHQISWSQAVPRMWFEKIKTMEITLSSKQAERFFQAGLLNGNMFWTSE